MNWIEQEGRRRLELEKSCQIKAQISAEKAAKELEKQQKNRDKYLQKIESARMKLVDRFANHVKKRLPEGTRIDERFVLSDDSNEPAPAVRIDVGNGVKLDLVKFTYKVVNFRFTGSCSADESSTTTHVVFDIFESGKATASRVDVPLIKIQKDLSRVDVPLIKNTGRFIKEIFARWAIRRLPTSELGSWQFGNPTLTKAWQTFEARSSIPSNSNALAASHSHRKSNSAQKDIWCRLPV